MSFQAVGFLLLNPMDEFFIYYSTYPNLDIALLLRMVLAVQPVLLVMYFLNWTVLL